MVFEFPLAVRSPGPVYTKMWTFIQFKHKVKWSGGSHGFVILALPCFVDTLD
jgi:hypothetical protein